MGKPYWFRLGDNGSQQLVVDVYRLIEVCEENRVNFGAVEAVLNGLDIVIDSHVDNDRRRRNALLERNV